jgi:hypothetical protein
VAVQRDDVYSLLQEEIASSHKLVHKLQMAMQANLELSVQVEHLKRELGSKQADIDRLMLEYCPEEMTTSQLEEWGKNQVPVLGSDVIANGT